MPRPVLLGRVQEPVRVTVSELDEAAVRQYGGLVYSLSVDVGVGVGVAWRQRRDAVRARYDAVPRLYVGTVQLQGNAVRGTNLG